ncbi:uncharacterized protein BDW47DRAFT_24124 [Aspergillus candidus]|uniref:Uncharacterized protein n=1 Tax=Aspergillus candidus TaxID=41067 RepID=A0A2I2FD53_ASPCN|nr:hypothetical protein BDW47DRAFT_24124 [Aspergillus candidus]PLB38571.1 hypothetical protein BDW47DRAFT_24124 [Aspergillus candidus]
MVEFSFHLFLQTRLHPSPPDWFLPNPPVGPLTLISLFFSFFFLVFQQGCGASSTPRLYSI